MDIPPEISQKLGGPAGSLVAMLFIQDSWPRRFVMCIAGGLLSWYGAANFATWLNINEGFAGFLLGLFGMSVVARVFQLIQNPELINILLARVRLWLGVKE